MKLGLALQAPPLSVFRRPHLRLLPLLVVLVIGGAFLASDLRAQQPASAVPVMTGRYHFLGLEDELAILQEETALKGFIDVLQGENESDAILSYPITIGSRHGDRVTFTTRAIHEKYYRFAGKIERGSGKKPGDPDYLRLVGQLETLNSDSVTGEHKVVRQQVVFKSMGKGEGEQP
jgi:hypothetical protein